jgi:Polyketide cyclase / dehydrase and lipid transport
VLMPGLPGSHTWVCGPQRPERFPFIHVLGQPQMESGSDMARVDVSTSSELDPAAAWKLASDLGRFGEWMTIFGGWRGNVPSTVEEGTRVCSLIKVKGFRNVIKWTVTRYDEPKSVELQGRGRGGVRVTVALDVSPKGDGSTFHLTADLTGSVLAGPVGKLVARVLRSSVRESVENLAALR